MTTTKRPTPPRRIAVAAELAPSGRCVCGIDEITAFNDALQHGFLKLMKDQGNQALLTTPAGVQYLVHPVDIEATQDALDEVRLD